MTHAQVVTHALGYLLPVHPVMTPQGWTFLIYSGENSVHSDYVFFATDFILRGKLLDAEALFAAVYFGFAENFSSDGMMKLLEESVGEYPRSTVGDRRYLTSCLSPSDWAAGSRPRRQYLCGIDGHGELNGYFRRFVPSQPVLGVLRWIRCHGCLIPFNREFLFHTVLVGRFFPKSSTHATLTKQTAVHVFQDL